MTKKELKQILAEGEGYRIGKKSVLRNPLIAGLLNRIEYIEKMGTGVPKMQRLMKNAGLKPVKFEFSTFFTTTFKRPHISPGRTEKEKSSEKSSEKILRIIAENKDITAKEIADIVGLSSRAVEKQIATLKKKRLLHRVGPAKGGHWEVGENGA